MHLRSLLASFPNRTTLLLAALMLAAQVGCHAPRDGDPSPGAPSPGTPGAPPPGGGSGSGSTMADGTRNACRKLWTTELFAVTASADVTRTKAPPVYAPFLWAPDPVWLKIARDPERRTSRASTSEQGAPANAQACDGLAAIFAPVVPDVTSYRGQPARATVALEASFTFEYAKSFERAPIAPNEWIAVEPKTTEIVVEYLTEISDPAEPGTWRILRAQRFAADVRCGHPFHYRVYAAMIDDPKAYDPLLCSPLPESAPAGSARQCVACQVGAPPAHCTFAVRDASVELFDGTTTTLAALEGSIDQHADGGGYTMTVTRLAFR